MGDCQNDDLADMNVEYDAPVSDAQAHRRVALQSLDLVSKGKRVESKLIERLLDPLPHRRIKSVELPRRFRSQNDRFRRAHAGCFSFTTLCSVWSADSKKRLTPRAAWRMRCSFSTSARRT